MTKSAEAFRTISEVAQILDTPTHVLRFWESKFSQVKPVKRAGGRRYYRPADVALLGGIKRLLHEDGLTIRGVQKMLKEQGVKRISELGEGFAPSTDPAAETSLPAPPARVVEAPKAKAPVAPIAAAVTQAKIKAPSVERPVAPGGWHQPSFFDAPPASEPVPEAPMALDVPTEEDAPPGQVVSLIVGSPRAPTPAIVPVEAGTDPLGQLRAAFGQIAPGTLSAAERARLLTLRERMSALRDALHQPPRPSAQP